MCQKDKEENEDRGKGRKERELCDPERERETETTNHFSNLVLLCFTALVEELKWVSVSYWMPSILTLCSIISLDSMWQCGW